MKISILVVVVAAGVAGFASSSYAQDVKKLQPHPAATANPSLQDGRVDKPSATDSHPGEAGPARALPHTGNAVTPGGSSTAQSKQK